MKKLALSLSSTFNHSLHTVFSVVTVSLITLLALSLSIVTSVGAITSISKNYLAESQLPVGSIVSLKANTVDEVAAASSSSVDNLLGVVINASTALIALTGTSDNEVQVATSGTAQVLVSSINGDIARGDHITASPITGIGMKATNNIRVIGVAQGDLAAGTATQETYTDADGIEQTVLIGQIPVLVNVSYYFKEPERTIIPTALQNVANALAGKQVDTLPIILAAAIFIVMLIVVVSIVYSMIKSSIISVGRNPLSQSAIYRDLIQLSALVVGILAVGLIAIYLILTRL